MKNDITKKLTYTAAKRLLPSDYRYLTLLLPFLFFSFLQINAKPSIFKQLHLQAGCSHLVKCYQIFIEVG